MKYLIFSTLFFTYLFNSFSYAKQNAYIDNWEFESRENINRVFEDSLKLISSSLLEDYNLYEIGPLEVDNKGNLVLFDFTNTFKIAFVPNGDLDEMLFFGNGKGKGPSEFGKPFDLKFDDEGNIWLADVGNFKIQKWSPQGKLLIEFKAPKYVRPSKIDYDESRKEIIVLSEQYTPNGVLYIFNENGDLKNAFQKPKKNETRSVLYFESEIVSIDEGFIIAGAVKPFFRYYKNNGDLVYSKGIVGYQNPEKILSREGRVTSRSKDLIRAVVDLQYSNGVIYAGISNKKNDRWIRFLDKYKPENGEYMASLKLNLPTKYFALHKNKLFTIEYNSNDKKTYLSEYLIE